jgi:hypothetical protein
MSEAPNGCYPGTQSALDELDRAIGIFGRATTETHLDPSDRYDAIKHVRDYLLGLRESMHGVAQRPTVPDGYALVPLLPTPRMVEVGCDNNPTQWNDGTPDGFAADVANDVYVSMVRASMVPSTEGK